MLGIFLDIEATGLDSTKHVPIDIAFIIVDLATGEIKNQYHSLVKQPWESWSKHDPVSIGITGISWEDLAKGKEMTEIKDEVVTIFEQNKIKRGNAVYICQNPSFDRAYYNQIIDVYTQEKFNWPYHWLDLASMYWASRYRDHLPIPESVSLSKNSIAENYNIPPEGSPHKALQGVKHLITCYCAVLEIDHWRLC